MSRVGFFCFVGAGHLYPAIALARGLKARGHQITIFHIAAARASVRAAGLDFCRIDEGDITTQPAGNSVENDGVRTILDAVAASTRRILRNAPKAIQEANIDGLVIDQSDLAGGSVADLLGLPFLTLSTSPPAYLDDETPQPYFHWKNKANLFCRLRNRLGNALVGHIAAPLIATINEQRKAWGLQQYRHINESFSGLGIITQLPGVLEFNGVHRPPHLLYAGPLLDAGARPKMSFPWHQLNDKPLIYASMGTILNDRAEVFRAIAEACSRFDAQLVLSLGGGLLLPEEFVGLPGNPIVVHYAPQLDLLKRATLTITHSGLNTTLESLYEGVPLVAVPISADQPGVAARVESAEAGCSVPITKFSVEALQKAIGKVLSDEKYRRNAQRIQAEIRKVDPIASACNFIEQGLGIGVSDASPAHSL